MADSSSLDHETATADVPLKGASELMGLFSPPPPTMTMTMPKRADGGEDSATDTEVKEEEEDGDKATVPLPEPSSWSNKIGAENEDDDYESQHHDDNAGSVSHFMSLFAPAPKASISTAAAAAATPPARPTHLLERQSTAPRSNRLGDSNNNSHEQTPLLSPEEEHADFSLRNGGGVMANTFSSWLAGGASDGTNWNENTPTKPSSTHGKMDSWFDFLISSPAPTTTTTTTTTMGVETPKTSTTSRKSMGVGGADFMGGPITPPVMIPPSRPGTLQRHSWLSSVTLPIIEESLQAEHQTPGPTTPLSSSSSNKATSSKNNSKWAAKSSAVLRAIGSECLQPSTYIGSLMFLMYHVVFCLANGSAILRPESGDDISVLGLMTKTAALGVIAASAVYWIGLGDDVPALYPTSDLFLAPFLANLAAIVDETLSADPNVTSEENDVMFLTTLGVLTAIGSLWSGTLLTLAGVFQLANMGSYLPFPVICGFFSAVGILIWTLAVSVDTGGIKIGHILFSGDWELIKFFLIHHTPTLIVAVIMKYLGPKNPFFVIMVVCATIGSAYMIMFVCGVSLEEAKDMGWFWSQKDLLYKNQDSLIGFDSWTPPAPFGVLRESFNGRIHWGAVYNGLSTSLAMGFLYLVRCSVHGTALKKNIPNLSRTVKADDPLAAALMGSPPVSPAPNMRRPAPIRSRKFSEAVDIEAVIEQQSNGAAANADNSKAEATVVIHAKPTNVPLKEILLQYGYSQFVVTLVGGIAITPAVAASPTMFALGADKVAPQVGAVILLLGFYLTDFQLVCYVPKPAFSAMLVLACFDMTITWCYRSWFKVKDKSEWMVVPAIIVCAFVLDLLTAVFLGIAFSTFIFVASFFRSGVVKFVASGVTIQSTIERTFRSGEWLNQNGHFIQIVVLHNYLFFGNATSVYAYISHVFEGAENNNDVNNNVESRTPKYVILDLALVTGMDTSTVDVFSDIKNLCASRKCKLFLAGMSPDLRSVLALGGIKPTTGVRSKRQLRFFESLDDALGKAEDMLLESDFHGKDTTAAKLNGATRRSMGADPGFRIAMRHIDEQHGDSFSFMLGGLQVHTRPVELQPTERLYCDGETTNIERGLFFIESGVMKIERDSSPTLTRGCMSERNWMSSRGESSLNKVDSITQLTELLMSAKTTAAGGGGDAVSQSFRLARIGPGWVAGAMEQVSGIRRQGEYIAVTHCRLHHLPYSKLEAIESENPTLILNLYKLLSYLIARRQEATVGQLAMLHSIMSSTALRGPLSKKKCM